MSIVMSTPTQFAIITFSGLSPCISWVPTTVPGVRGVLLYAATNMADRVASLNSVFPNDCKDTLSVILRVPELVVRYPVMGAVIHLSDGERHVIESPTGQDVKLYHEIIPVDNHLMISCTGAGFAIQHDSKTTLDGEIEVLLKMPHHPQSATKIIHNKWA